MRSAGLLVALLACGDGQPAAPDAVRDVDAAPDAPPKLHRLASTGVQLVPSLGVLSGETDLAADVDVVAIHEDFYGVPWDAFAANQPPPAAWVSFQQDIAMRAHALGKDIFLSLTPLAGNRADLAGNVVAGGTGFQIVNNWKPRCYDLATAGDGAMLRTAYARYVAYMIDLFHPTWIAIAIELNEWHLQCGAAWDGMVALERDAYDAAKASAPGVPAFPTIQLDPLYGKIGCATTESECYETEYAALANLKRDRFAVSTYPYAFFYPTPDLIPADWFTRAAARGGEKTLVAETGWLGTNLVATNASAACQTAVASTPDLQAAYFDRVFADAVANDMDIVNWISNSDFIDTPVMTDCPCTYSTDWCGIVTQARGSGTPGQQFSAEVGLKQFGAMGIRAYDGTARQPIYDHFQAARSQQ